MKRLVHGMENGDSQCICISSYFTLESLRCLVEIRRAGQLRWQTRGKLILTDGPSEAETQLAVQPLEELAAEEPPAEFLGGYLIYSSCKAVCSIGWAQEHGEAHHIIQYCRTWSLQQQSLDFMLPCFHVWQNS